MTEGRGGAGGWEAAEVGRLGARPWVVLGGGGLKGLAHIGAWQALEEAGVEVSGIVGTSIGALVGACVAGGMGWSEMAPIALDLEKTDIIRVSRAAVWVNGIRAPAVFLGDTLQEYIDGILPVAEWDGLALPFQANAVDLSTGETEWFGTGARTDVPLAEVLYASAALPVLYPPALLGGRYYVDGGAVDALPLLRAEEVGATGIIAVDVGAGGQVDATQVVEKGMVAIHQRIFSIMSGRRRRESVSAWTRLPLLYVRPRLDGYDTFDFAEIRYFLEEGYRATRAALMGEE